MGKSGKWSSSSNTMGRGHGFHIKLLTRRPEGISSTRWCHSSHVSWFITTFNKLDIPSINPLVKLELVAPATSDLAHWGTTLSNILEFVRCIYQKSQKSTKNTTRSWFSTQWNPPPPRSEMCVGLWYTPHWFDRCKHYIPRNRTTHEVIKC